MAIADPTPVTSTQPATTQPNDMVLLAGGAFDMGTNDGQTYERPVHRVSLKPYWIDKREVAVRDFKKFVDVTGFITEAEKFGWSGVFTPAARDWGRVDGANWHHPEGPNAAAAEMNEPVTHISYADATAYAEWAGKRLPTEAEFEFAARGGHERRIYAWGNDLTPAGMHLANNWQGVFPENDLGSDDFKSVAPVGSYPPNDYGLYDITGNVWEWCSDWFSEDYYRNSPADNPKGPDFGQERVQRGGSWLCSENYCVGYRVASRQKTAPDSGLNNLGFRCVRDATAEELHTLQTTTAPAR
ncbi:MAG: formylglycine-generating enzyme family protein [Chthoniobacterales bacterium]|nr:formylglycine-generating enzyme family protein [Chthoniobacterales bacterium]